MLNYFVTVRGIGIEDADHGLLEQNPSREGKSKGTKLLGEGGWKQEAIKQQKKVYKTFIISWSSFTGKFIKRFALLLLLKLMNETVTDIYFYNFIFKSLFLQGTKPNHCSSTVKSTDEAFCHLRKAWFFGSINTFM